MIFNSNFPDISIPPIGVYQYITSNPNNVPEKKILFIDGTTDKKITFGEFKIQTRKLATGLHDKAGFRRGDVLTIISPNQVDYPVVIFGAIAAGGKVSPVNPKYSISELSCQLTASGASIIFSHPSCLSTTIEAAAEAQIHRSKIFLINDEEINGIQPYSTLFVDRKFDPIEYTPEEAKHTTVFLCFSSGTTGKNKGVETTHTNMVANVKQIVSLEADYDQNKIFMGVVPFYHIYGLTVLHISLLLGATTVLIPKFDLATFCRVIQDYKVNYAHLMPPIILSLVKNPIVKEYDLSSLRVIISAAAPLGKPLVDNVFGIHNVLVKQAYGLTEATPFISWAEDKKSAKYSVGMLLPNIEAKIIAEDGKELGYGERGELCVRGPNVMKGYLNNEDATNASFDNDGFLYTGDAAYIDKQGNLFIVDRLKELIKYNGFQVAPAELEEILISHPVVLDVAVVGVNCEADATEYPLAYVTLQTGYERTPEIFHEIMEYISNKVTPYKILKDILYIDQIPKSASGKILRRILRDKARTEYIFSRQI